MTRRDEMIELVKAAHAAQFRNNGRVPYWMHVLSVGEILTWAIDRGGEIADVGLREDLFLAALGHDLYEDTDVGRAEIESRFGPRVHTWVQGMTNDGDQDRTAYLAWMAAAPEEVRLIKLADVVENTASCSYAIPDMGIEWTAKTFLPIATEMTQLMKGATFARYPRTAAALVTLMEFHHERLRSNLAMFACSTAEPTPPTPPKPRIGGPAPDEISAEDWARALERTRAREQKEAELFGGLPPFPIPHEEES